MLVSGKFHLINGFRLQKLGWKQTALLLLTEYVVLAILAFPSSYAVLVSRDAEKMENNGIDESLSSGNGWRYHWYRRDRTGNIVHQSRPLAVLSRSSGNSVRICSISALSWTTADSVGAAGTSVMLRMSCLDDTNSLGTPRSSDWPQTTTPSWVCIRSLPRWRFRRYEVEAIVRCTGQ